MDVSDAASDFWEFAASDVPLVGGLTRQQKFEMKRTAKRDALRMELLSSQGGVCAICGTDDPGTKHGWSIDHDHTCCPTQPKSSCGECDRGVLCHTCNTIRVAFVEGPFYEATLAYLGRV